MNTSVRLRLLAVAASCLCQSGAWAQEPPAETPPPAESAAATAPAAEAPTAEPAPEQPPPSESLPVEPATTEPAPAETPTVETPLAETPPTPETGAAPRAGAKRIVMLPVEFVVYQKSVAGIEAVPDWSETAQFSLSQAAFEMLRKDERFQVVDAPEFDGETEGLLREHVELFKLVAGSALMFVQYGGKAWAEKKTHFDYTLGDGLQFLAGASGADYAFLMIGSQVTQTGGAAFMQFLLAAGGVGVAGGGTFISGGIVDLRTGDLKWLNSKQGMQMFGVTGSDARNPATASELVAKLFEEFPSGKVLNFPPF